MRRTARIFTSRGERRIKGTVARVAVLVVVLALGFALVKLQVMDVREYATIARDNRMRAMVIPAPRGAIYDRHGQVIAENVVGYQIQLMPAPKDTLLAQLRRLQPIIGLADADIDQAFKRWRRQPHLPMDVMADAPPIAVARLEERRFLFPQVLVNEYPKRHYVAGDAVSHFIGYVAEISERELSMPQFAGYRQGRWIGKAGLERSYEKALSGEPGMRYLEVDAMGRIKKWLPEELGTPPIPGRDLQLYLDLDLQRYVQRIFPDSMDGAVVALDPRSGGVLAYYASPNYDPNQFVGGIPLKYWNELRQDPRVPLLDRAGGAAQPPGSTYKLPIATMGLELGVLKPEDHMPVPCTGGMAYQGRYARCWDRRGHGYLDLVGAIKNSCDVYFYQVGIRIGLRRFLAEGTRLGFGSRTGVDLPSEFAPSFPENLEWWQERFGYRPAANEVMSLAIGQGGITASPLKLAQMYVALARDDGQAPAPRFAQGDSATPITYRTNLRPDQIAYLRQGMRLVLGPGGTAWLSRLKNWDLMGKTGTAQNPHGKDHGLFVGIGGPHNAPPEIVVAMLLEHGEHGATASGYVADAVNFFLDRKYRRPFDPYPTPRDQQQHGIEPDWNWLTQPIPPMPPRTSAAAPAAPGAPPQRVTVATARP